MPKPNNMYMKKVLLLFALFVIIFSPKNLEASHAAGLDLTYECVGFVPGGQPGIELFITINSGTFGTEISWNITDQNGNIVASGNGYQSNQVYNITECVPAGTYDFNMFDSFGDGWNGGTYDLSTSNGNIGSGGLLTGSVGTDVFTLSNGDPCVTQDSYEYELTAKFYRDCAGISAPISLIAQTTNSCGLTNPSITLTQVGIPVEASPICPGYATTCTGGTYPGIEEYTYTGTFTLPGECVDWTFSVSECCRNALITNLANPGGDNIYVEAVLNNTGNIGCNSSPFFSNVPVSFICSNQYYCYNNGALDPDGDSLAYFLIDPLTANATPVVYNAPYTGQQPFDGLTTFNNNSGNVCVTPNSPQVTVMAIKVEEYRNGVLIGSVIRDIQVNVDNCPGNDIPSLTGLNGMPLSINNTDTAICPGTPLDINLYGSDPNSGDLLNITLINSNLNGSNFNISGNNTGNPVGNLTWTPSVNDTNSIPYVFTISVNDDACPYNSFFTASYTVLVTPNVASLLPLSDVCESDPQLTLTQGIPSGGTYSGTGVINGNFNPMSAGPGTHTITYSFTNNIGCSGSDTQDIIVEEMPNAGFDGTSVLCDNAPSFDLFSVLGGTPQSSGIWTDINGNPVNNMFNPNSQSSSVFIYTIAANACPDATANADITINQMPVANAGNDTIVCGSSFDMKGQASVGNGLWTVNSNSIDILNPDYVNSTVIVNEYGTYTFTWTENNNNCISSDEVEIEFVEPPFELAIDPPYSEICPGESVILSIGDDFDTYQWMRDNIKLTNTNQPSIVVEDGGEYKVEVTNSICSAVSPPAVVYEVPILDPTILTRPDTIICPVDEPFTIEVVTPGGSWIGNGVNYEGLFIPINAPLGENIIYYTLSNNCNEIDSILIELGCELQIFIPNVFTPNSDEHNEKLVIKAVNLLDFEISIYSRWGELIFYSNDIENRWDGKFNGNIAPTGVYSYVLKAYGKDGQAVNKQGTITILK